MHLLLAEPHTMSSDLTLVHQQNPEPVLCWVNPLSTAAGSAAPCLLFRALPCMCRFCWTRACFFSASVPSWEPLHLLTSSELPSSLPMKFQNPGVELQFNNTTTKGCLYRGMPSHSKALQPQTLPSACQGPSLPPLSCYQQGGVEHCLSISPFPGWACVPH